MKKKKICNILKEIVMLLVVSAAIFFMVEPTKAEALNGVYQNSDGVWSYYRNGVIDTQYTGLAQNENGWWYIKDGFVDFTYMGYVEYDGSEWCVVGGTIDFNLTDILYWQGKFYRVINGRWTKEYTGLAENESGWWYVKDGLVDFTYTGYVEYNNKEWCVIYGGLYFNITDVLYWEDNWYRVYNGYWDKTYTGLAENENGWWYVKDGLVDFTYTGLVENEFGIWYVKDGNVRFDINEAVKINNRIYKLNGGLCDENYEGVVLYDRKWMYLSNNSIDDAFTGIASNENGDWYLFNGQVAFNYTGTVKYKGVVYHVTEGYVDGIGNFTGVKIVGNERLYYNEGVYDQSYNGNAKDEQGLQWHIKNGVADGMVGIDVSTYQKDIDWDAVKADGIQFAIIRVGYGSDDMSQDDNKAIRNMDECQRIGMPYGVYLFSYAVSEEEAYSERDHLLRMLSGRNPSMGVYLDIEATAYYQNHGLDPYSDDGKARLMQYIDIVMDGISPYYKAGVYANYHYFTSILDKNAIDEIKWLAIYGRDDCPDGDWVMWQYTSQGSVSGIDGNVDMNIWFT